MMNITAKQMNEIATSIFRKEADEAIVRVEKSIQERAERGEKIVTVNLDGLRMRAFDLILEDLTAANFSFSVLAGHRVMITW